MKSNFKIILKIAAAAIGILILSVILHAISMDRSSAYLQADGKTYAVKPYKSIPFKATLASLNITSGKDDILSCNPDKPVAPLQNIKLTRVTKQEKRVTEKFPFRITWSRVYNSNLRKTELERGVEKTVVKIVVDTYYDGELYNRETLDERSISNEHYRLVLFDKRGNVEKIYDLSKAKRRNMIATAYYPGDPLAWGDGKTTVLGQQMQRGIVAVDPRVIPLKTRLFISGYGYGYAGDTGNLIKRNRIDLGVSNAEEEKSWMFRNVTVYILEPSDEY